MRGIFKDYFRHFQRQHIACDHNLNFNLVSILLSNIGLYSPILNFQADHDREIWIFSHLEQESTSFGARITRRTGKGPADRVVDGAVRWSHCDRTVYFEFPFHKYILMRSKCFYKLRLRQLAMISTHYY